MIISRTPYRISFFGGGTDYPAWYLKHGGAVLSSSVDKFCYLTCRYLPPFFEHRSRIVYSRIEACQNVDDIKHPAVRAILQYMEVERGLEIHHDGDLPARSGVGTSSSFCVGLIHALRALKGQISSKHDLALEAIHIEQNLLKETVGSQDQVSAAHGGFNLIRFHPSGDITIVPMVIPQERLVLLNDHLMLFYTGIMRTSSDIAATYVADIAAKEKQLHLYSEMLEEAVVILNDGKDLNAFGELLHEAWTAKKSLSKDVSNSEIDEIYEGARKAGAIGGKILGAGGGGFMLLYAPPEKHKAIRKTLNDLLQVPFRFDFSGSQIIYFSREQDYLDQDKFRSEHTLRAFHELKQNDNQPSW